MRRGDRPQFESLVKQYRSEIQAAARHFGVSAEAPEVKIFYKLLTCWAPKYAESIIEAALHLLPEKVRFTAYKTGSHLLTPTPFQMMFIDHVKAIRN